MAVGQVRGRIDGAGGDIFGATSATYTPDAADLGDYLRATATYDDAEASGQSGRGGERRGYQRATGWDRDPVVDAAGGGNGGDGHAERS